LANSPPVVYYFHPHVKKTTLGKITLGMGVLHFAFNIFSLQCIRALRKVIFLAGFVQPQNPPSGFDAPIPPVSNTYVPPTTPSHTPSIPGGFSPFNPSPATFQTSNDGGMNSLHSAGNYDTNSAGSGNSSSEGTV
jgi:hypothetical protein